MDNNLNRLNNVSSIVNAIGHWFFWTGRNGDISLLRIFIATAGYGLGVAALALLPGADKENSKIFLELVVIVFAMISVFEIADGVILSKKNTEILRVGDQKATALVPTLLIDASQKCKLGLVFAIYGWLADLVVKNFL